MQITRVKDIDNLIYEYVRDMNYSKVLKQLNKDINSFKSYKKDIIDKTTNRLNLRMTTNDINDILKEIINMNYYSYRQTDCEYENLLLDANDMAYKAYYIQLFEGTDMDVPYEPKDYYLIRKLYNSIIEGW